MSIYWRMKGNTIGAEGENSMSQMMKMNTTLTTLDLSGKERVNQGEIKKKERR